MALSIKDEDTDRLVRRYADLKGFSYTQAVRVAVTSALELENALPEGESFIERIKRIQDRVAGYPRRRNLTDDEIIGYDENGLPT